MRLMMLWRQLCVEMCEGWGSEQDCCGRLNITQVRRRRAVSRYLVSVHSVPRYLVSAHCMHRGHRCRDTDRRTTLPV